MNASEESTPSLKTIHSTKGTYLELELEVSRSKTVVAPKLLLNTYDSSDTEETFEGLHGAAFH